MQKKQRAKVRLWDLRRDINDALISYIDPGLTEELETWLDKRLGHDPNGKGLVNDIVNMLSEAIEEI